MNAVLLLSMALALGAPGAKDEPKKDAPSLVGEWTAESAVFGGMPVPKAPENMKFTFTKEGKLIVNEGGKGNDDEGGYKIDSTKKPAEMDLIPPEKVKEPTIQAIFKLEGDTLTICAQRGQGKRPTEFTSTKENMNMLITLKRTKK